MNNTIDFCTAEKIIAISQVTGLSPLFIGENGIGKSMMLEHHSKKNPNARLIKSLNKGGMQRSQEIRKYQSEKVNTLYLHDLNRLLSEKNETMARTFDEIADCIDGYHSDVITYHKDDIINLNMKFNFINAVSPVGWNKLKRSQSTWDYLTRCPIFFIKDKNFSSKFDYDLSKLSIPIETTELTDIELSPRHKIIIDKLNSGLKVLGHSKPCWVYLWTIGINGEAEILPVFLDTHSPNLSIDEGSVSMSKDGQIDHLEEKIQLEKIIIKMRDDFERGLRKGLMTYDIAKIVHDVKEFQRKKFQEDLR